MLFLLLVFCELGLFVFRTNWWIYLETVHWNLLWEGRFSTIEYQILILNSYGVWGKANNDEACQFSISDYDPFSINIQAVTFYSLFPFYNNFYPSQKLRTTYIRKIAFCHVIFRDRSYMCLSLCWAKFAKNWQFYSIAPFQTTNTFHYRYLRWCLLKA